MSGWNPPTITTERLVIRPMVVSDLQCVHAFTSACPTTDENSTLWTRS